MSNPEASTILLIDDHPMLRTGVKQLISMAPELAVVGEAGNGEQGVQLAEELDPDLILLDLNMPGMNGLETLDCLREKPLSGRIVVFSVSNHEEDVVTALKRGADGYLLKDMEPELVVEFIRDALQGALVISPGLTRVLAQALRSPQPHAAVELTERERQVLRTIAGGYSNKVIGHKLGITEGTVKVHVKNVLHKLGLRSRVEAAVWAMEHLRQVG